MMTKDAVAGPIAYLTGDYPKVSHTFILREVQAVRAAGVPVITCSIRQPPASEFKGAEERAARQVRMKGLMDAAGLPYGFYLSWVRAATGRRLAPMPRALTRRPLPTRARPGGR